MTEMMEERIPQAPTEAEVTRMLPPEAASGTMTPIPVQAQQPAGMDLGTPEDIEALLAAALDKEFLRNHPNGVEIQRLATSINMLLKDPRIPASEKQRLLEELIPQLLALMEEGMNPNL